MTSRVYKNMSANKSITFTEKELECIRVCVSNAPSPYDIRLKKVPASIIDKIGEPTPLTGEPLVLQQYDLTQYGINN